MHVTNFKHLKPDVQISLKLTNFHINPYPAIEY